MPELIARQENRSLHFIHHSNYESRGTSLETLIRLSVEKFQITRDFNLRIWTGDQPNGTYSFSTESKDYKSTFPCFLYDSWPECGVPDYQEMTSSLEDVEPETKKVGWIGAPMTASRKLFVERYGNTWFSEGLTNEWDRADPEQLWRNTKTYLTFQEQINRWKYLLDCEGIGWSARLKVLLCSPRIVFIVERPYEEWFFEFLVPWKHYVPIKRDLSDLTQRYFEIEKDQALQQTIRTHQAEFAKTYLTRDAALQKIRQIIERD